MYYKCFLNKFYIVLAQYLWDFLDEPRWISHVIQAQSNPFIQRTVREVKQYHEKIGRLISIHAFKAHPGFQVLVGKCIHSKRRSRKGIFLNQHVDVR